MFRNPVEFLEKSLIDIRFGPGYIANENFRRYNSLDKQATGSHHGVSPIYDLRFGPVNISNVFTQAGFTRGKGPRIGLLFTYTGDEYASDQVAKRVKTVFGGGFVGYGPVTFYGYTDLLNKKAGSIFTARFAPSLVKTKRQEISLVFEAEHMNHPYTDYYFGIRPYEANSRLRAYSAKRTTNFSATLLYIFSLGKRFEFSLWGGEKRYGQGVTSSPTVGLRHEYRAGAGILFHLF